MNNEERITNLTSEVLTHIKSKDMTALKTLLSSANEVDALEMIQDLSDENQAIVFRLLSKDTALFVFERLDTSFQHQLIRSFTEESAIEMIAALDPDERVRLFDEMPAAFVKKMLPTLSPNERDMTNMLMGYEAETAGRIMTPEYVHLHKGITAGEALEAVKAKAVDSETIYTIYITDSERKLEGVITLRDLLIADPAAIIDDVMDKNAAQVSTDTDQEEVARLLQRLDWLTIPVVDKENRLVGIVTVDDAMDILEDETTEDILDAAGFADVAGKEADRSVVLTRGSLPRIWAVRLPYLLIALIGGLAAGFIIEGFEEILEAVVVVAFFIPVILDMGGSVGSQSTTVFARGVVLGHVNIKNFFKPFLKEVWVGFTIGVILGAVAAGVIMIWQGIPRLALTVGIALALTMTVAATLGFLTPFVIMKLKGDQAAGSAPIITTIKDITGLFIYFGLVVLLMGSYLYAGPGYEITGMNVTVDGIHFFVDLDEETAIVIGRDEGALDLEIPETIIVQDEEFEVIGIEDSAFRGASLTSVVLPETIIEIGANAFRDNGLISITLPYGIVDIGAGAFRDNQLMTITIPNRIVSVGDSTFRDNQLVLVVFPGGLEVIGESAFRGNLLEEIDLPDSLTEIGRGGFRDNKLSYVNLPDSLQVLGPRAFMGNNLMSVSIPGHFTGFASQPGTGQMQHFHNNSLVSISTDAGNATALAGMLTVDVMGYQSPVITTIYEGENAAYQRNRLATHPVWTAME
ncbi:MAG: magnesium transporter [Defluviitaleaceae bacterium]|nr:magnesium transporter [Defluviitaleaceae bacterium]